jgi:two-component system, sensor histidine kinase
MRVDPAHKLLSSCPPAAAADILVVDDTPASAGAVAVALEDLSLRVVTANSGAEGLRYLLDHDVAVILLDVRMPTMDGFETARLIRARRRNRHVPIIFITAYDRDDREMLKAYELGAIDLLFKPIRPEVLRAKVTVLAELSRRTVEVALQAQEIARHHREERERELAEQRRRLEAQALRQRLEEQRAHAAQLEHLNRELAAADERKDEFLAVLAHELRNPLAPLVGGLALFERTRISEPHLVRALQAMTRQTQHLVRLVDDLLDVSRITRGKIALRRAPVRVGDVLDQAIAIARPLITAGDHELREHRTCDDLVLQCDGVRVAQIVSNLLANATRHADPGGHIDLCAQASEDGVTLSVADDGWGMPAKLLGRIFEPFVQERTGGGGLGLGLALVERLTRLHGGRVCAHSDGPGCGSRFEVWLPRGRPDATPRTRPSLTKAELAPPANGHSGVRVVLVEDDEDARVVTADLLASFGYKVCSADDGEQGITLIQNEKPDLAFIDLGLPGVSGYDVARSIRHAMGAASPRLVALSGFGQAVDRQRALEAGFDHHIAKPASPEVLQNVVTSYTADPPD